MQVKLLSRHAYLQYIILVILAAGLWLRPFMSGCGMIEAGPESPLYQWLYTIIPAKGKAAVIIGFILILIEAISLNYILIKNQLLPPKTLFTAYIYVLIMSQSPAVLTLNPVICGSLFAIPAFGLILWIYRHPKPYYIVFLAAMLLAIASMFCFEMIFFLALVFISFLVFGKRDARLVILASSGFIFVYLLLFLFYFLTDSPENSLSYYIKWFTHPPMFWTQIEIYQYILLGWQVYIMYMAIKYIAINMKTLKKGMQKMLLLCIYFIPLSLFSIFYMLGNLGMAVLLSAMPFSIFLGIYISLTTKKSMIWLQLMFLFSWYLGLFLQNMYLAKC